MPSVLWDGLIIPGGAAAQTTLAALGQALEFLKDQYRHCKPILVLGGSTLLLDAASIPARLPGGAADPGLIVEAVDSGAKTAGDGSAVADGGSAAVVAFMAALARHRAFEREMDPPAV